MVMQSDSGTNESATGEAGHGEGAHTADAHAPGGHAEGEHHFEHLIIVTSPIAEDVISTQSYVCQIHSQRHIEVRALERGYLEKVSVQEGQSVKQGDVMFHLLPILYQAKLESETAERNLVAIEQQNVERLFEKNVVSQQEVNMVKAKMANADAKVKMAQAELNFANVKAPFDGIVDRQMEQLGSLVEEGDILTTLSDNSVMWVYFNVPEKRYLEYTIALDEERSDQELNIDLMLADHSKFPQPGQINAIEADFNNETGNIAFRADFENPKGLLRNGQTGKILIHKLLKNAVVIPQRATYEILAKRYVFVVDDEDVVHQREIKIADELDDIFVIGEGVKADEKIILEGILQVRDGDKIKYEYREPQAILDDLKNHAE